MNSFIKVSVDIFFLPKMGLSLKIICCMFDQSLLCPLEGKYCSATAPLVLYIDFFQLVNSLHMLVLCFSFMRKLVDTTFSKISKRHFFSQFGTIYFHYFLC